MTTQTPSTEERLSRLEGAYEQVSERLGDLRSEMNALREEVQRGQEALREEMQRGHEALREEMQRGQDSLRADINSFRSNMLLLMGGVWATVVGGLIALFTQF